MGRDCDLSYFTSEDGTCTENAQQKAPVLNDFFSSVFTYEYLSQIPILEDRYQNDRMGIIHITPKMILKMLNKLKVYKTAGLDGLHPRILKETAEAISTPLAKIFNISLQAGELSHT